MAATFDWYMNLNTTEFADILQVTLDELVGCKEASFDIKIRNQKLHNLCQQAIVLRQS